MAIMTRTETAFAVYLLTQRSTTQTQVDARTAKQDAERGGYVAHQAHTTPQGSRH
jgi:hypothetical protein